MAVTISYDDNGNPIFLDDGLGDPLGSGSGNVQYFVGVPQIGPSKGGPYGKYTVDANGIPQVYIGDPRAPSSPAAPKAVEPPAGWLDTNNDGIDDRTGLAEGVWKQGNEYFVLVNGEMVQTTPQGAALPKEVEPPKTVTLVRGGVKGVYALGPDGKPGGLLYVLDDTTVGGGGYGSGGGYGGGLTQVFRNSQQMLADQGRPKLSAQEEVALINAKVNAAKAYSESLMNYDPAAYGAFLSAQGGGTSLANAINSGKNAISPNMLKSSQDILDQIAKLDRMGGPKTQITGARPPITSGGLTSGASVGGNMPMYAYGTPGMQTTPGVMMNAAAGGMPPRAGGLNRPNGGTGSGTNWWGTAAKPTDTQLLEREIIRRANMMSFGPTKYTSINDIPADQIRRIQAGIAASRAKAAELRARSPQINYPMVLDENGNYQINPAYIAAQQKLAAEAAKQKAIASMTPAEKLLWDKLNPVQPAMAFGAFGFGGGEGLTPPPVAPTATAPSVAADGTMPPAAGTTLPVAGTTTPQVNPQGNTVLGYGGMSTARMAIVGDPQHDGGPNPEIIYNPTGAPFMVKPMKDMVPKYAYGTRQGGLSGTSSTDPYQSGTGETTGTGSQYRGGRDQTPGGAATEDPEAARMAAQYPWMNDPNYFMNVDFWKQDPVLRDLYLKGLQVSKGIPAESIMAAANANRLSGTPSGGVTGQTAMQLGW